MNVVSNHFHVKVDNFEEIHIFSVHHTPKIPLDNVMLRRKLLEDNREKIKAYIGKISFYQDQPVISGNNIYSQKAPMSENFEI